MPLTPTQTIVSVSAFSMEKFEPKTPAVAKFGSRLVAFWTEFTTTGQLQMGHAAFNEDGTVATPRVVENSSLIPKALIQTKKGELLLIASSTNVSTSPPQYRLVAQHIDANLNLVGPTYPIDSTTTLEPTRVEVHPSNQFDRVLINFRTDRSRHRIIPTDLCQ
jgi:hypothetical protein